MSTTVPWMSLIGALIALVGCGSHTMPTSTPASSPPRIVAVLGDSLSVSPSREASFPAVLQRKVEERGDGWRVMNSGRNGDVTAEGLSRLPEVLATQPAILVLALGANDGLRGVPVETVRQNLETIITRALERGTQVLLCGMEAPPLRGWRYSVEFHRIYPGLAEQYELPLVPFLMTGVIGNFDLNRDDRVHPNARGAERIAETVWPVLEPMLGAAASAPVRSAGGR